MLSGRSGSRSLRLFQAFGGLLLLTGVLSAFAFSGRASAGTGPGASGNTIPGAAAAQQPFTPNTPFDSGQKIDVVVPANSVLTPGAQIFILECAAPNGVNPTSTTSCDGNTGYAGGTITVNSDGSIDVINSSSASGLPYIIYALPDLISLGEPPTNQPKCGLGAANECVLYIGQGGGNDTGFSQPHFFSQAFQVHTDSTDSGTTNPGDGSPAQSGGSVSSTLSTVSPSSQNATADGADPANVTVTLNDSSSSPVQGKTVSLSAGAGHATVVPTSTGSNVTDSNGQATFTVTDTTAEKVTLTATDTTDTITVTQTAQVTFNPPTVNQSVSGVTANPTQVANDGTTASTLTVKLLDTSVHGQPAPLTGKTVSVAPSGGSSVITNASSGSNVTNLQGIATFTVTDTANEAVTYTATDSTDSVTLTGTATVQFGVAPPVSATKSTVVANPPNPFTGTGGTNGTTITVTLLASDGTTAIAGKLVTLNDTGSSTVSISGGNTGTSNGAGQVTFFATDTTPETVTFSATDTTDSITLQAQPSVTFTNPPPPTISTSLSTAQVTGSPPADGSTVATIAITILDTTGKPVSGVPVTVTSNSSTALVDPVLGTGTGTPGTTDAQGQTDWGVRDTKAETVTLTIVATDPTSGTTFTLSTKPTATFSAGSPDANASTVAAAPTSVPADGSTASTVTVTLTDFYSNPVQGKAITLKASGGSSKISATPAGTGSTPGTTNAAGVATFAVTDGTNEAVTYSAVDSTDSLTLSALATVDFGNVVVVPAKGDSGATVNASKVVADGKTPAVITVTLRDANGLPVTGKMVSLAPSGGSSVVSAAPAASSSVASGQNAALPRDSSSNVTTDSNGVAAFDATDTVAESVTYTATDTTDSMSGWTVTVAFTAASATATTAPAAGSTAPAAASAASGGTGSAGDTGGGSGGSGSGSGASSPALAFTGAGAALPWLFGLGALFLLIGTLGRMLRVVGDRSR